jgi:hypothetical protein
MDKRVKKGSKNKNQEKDIVNIKERDLEEIDEDTEMAVLPMRHFHALIENKDSIIEKYDDDRIRLACELKQSQEETQVYIEALQKTKDGRREYRNKCEVLEKELDILKNRVKPNPKIKEIINKSNSILEVEDRAKKADDYYKKHYSGKIEQLRKKLLEDDD